MILAIVRGPYRDRERAAAFRRGACDESFAGIGVQPLYAAPAHLVSIISGSSTKHTVREGHLLCIIIGYPAPTVRDGQELREELEVELLHQAREALGSAHVRQVAARANRRVKGGIERARRGLLGANIAGPITKPSGKGLVCEPCNAKTATPD
jgi:hypothetical protein